VVYFGNKGEFEVWNEETLQGAQIMLDEFGQGDGKLAQRIKLAIKEGRKRFAEYQKKQADAKKIEDDIIHQMR